MKFTLNGNKLLETASDCFVVGIFEDGELSPAAKKLDKACQQLLTKLAKQADFPGKIGKNILLHQVPHLPCKRVLLVGCGKNQPLSARDYRKIIFACSKELTQIKTAALFLTELAVEKHDLPWKIKQAVEVCTDSLYQFDAFKSKKSPQHVLQSIALFTADAQLSACKTALQQGQVIAESVTYTKDIANLPSNICTPTYISQAAKALAKKYPKLKVKVLDQAAIKKLGMGAMYAVAKGSAQPAQLISLEYHGGSKKQKPVAFVGKGITFDTGGISLKSADGMVGMKYDMCGAATVLGTLKAAVLLKLPLNLVGVIAAAENMPSGTACKPEDIVTTLSGQTVEIMNTDAEGRLVLCDALTYCERFKPDTVIDIATLTGAVVIALGHHASGLLSNHEPLAKDLLTAGIDSHDRAWQLPLWEDYQEQLNSPFADMSNVGGRSAGTITAACFLSRFANTFHWAHLDVAGTAAMMGGGNDRYATGRPVPLLVQYLINKCEA